MNILQQHEEQIPSYALPYLINGDDSNLESEDAANIEKWLAKYDIIPNSWMDVSIDNPDQEEYFTSRPAFGLPCNVLDCTVTVFLPD